MAAGLGGPDAFAHDLPSDLHRTHPGAERTGAACRRGTSASAARVEAQSTEPRGIAGLAGLNSAPSALACSAFLGSLPELPAPGGELAQLVERDNGIVEVRGSTPLLSTTFTPTREVHATAPAIVELRLHARTLARRTDRRAHAPRSDRRDERAGCSCEELTEGHREGSRPRARKQPCARGGREQQDEHAYGMGATRGRSC